jgi:sugar lactone lactonase YvrE
MFTLKTALFVLLAALPLAAQYRVTAFAGGSRSGSLRADRIWFTPHEVAGDRDGNLYVSDLQSVYRIAPSLETSIVAGNGSGIEATDGAAAADSGLDLITGLAVTRDGSTLYIAEGPQNRIRRVELGSGTITTLPTGGATLSRPGSLAIDPQGRLLVADQGNFVVRRIDPASGDSQIVAGNGTPGGQGEGIAALEAQLSPVFGIAVDAEGTLYIADTFNRRVRRVDAATGIIATVPTAELNYPTRILVDRRNRLLIAEGTSNRVAIFDPTTLLTGGYFGFLFPIAIAEDGNGRIVVADQGLNRLLRVDPDSLLYEWFASAPQDGDGGPATDARLSTPLSLAVSPSGSLVFSDELAHKIRSISPDGVISTVMGEGAPGSVRLPKAITFDPAGNLYILDAGFNRILRRTPDGAVDAIATRVQPGDGIAVDAEGRVYFTFGHAIYRARPEAPHERIAGSTLFEGAVGLAFDSAGQLYVAERDAGRIRKVDVNSGEETLFASDLSQPAGLAFDGEGSLWVAESGAARVTRISPAGDRTSITGPFRYPAYVATSGTSVFITDLRSNRIFRADRE